MSWSLFVTECQALTGMKHVSRVQYSQIMASAYQNCVQRHFETVTGLGTPVSLIPKYPILYNGFLNTCEENLGSHREINWLRQIGKFIIRYWDGAVIVGPTGIVTVTNMGNWLAPNIKQNLDFNIMLYSYAATARIHLMTLAGTYVSTVIPGLSTPWSGVTLQTTP